MTRIGGYCFDSRIAACFVMGTVAVFAVAPPIIQAFFLMFVGTCPITTLAGIWKVAKFHTCAEGAQEWERPRRRDDEEERIEPNPYAGLASSLFGRRK